MKRMWPLALLFAAASLTAPVAADAEWIAVAHGKPVAGPVFAGSHVMDVVAVQARGVLRVDGRRVAEQRHQERSVTLRERLFVQARAHSARSATRDARVGGTGCRGLGTTVQATSQARLFLRDHRLYGCLKPRGRIWLLWDGRNWADPAASVGALRLAGTYFAGVLPWAEGVFGGALIRRTNLATGATRTTDPIATAPMDEPFVEKLILVRRGGVAWAARSSVAGTVRCWGRRGRVHVLDSAPAAYGRSLRLVDGRLTWMGASTRHSVPMC